MESKSSTESSLPQVIFLDAMGTLFGIRGSVGEVYRAIASHYGVIIDANTIERAFKNSFQNASPLAFPTLKNQNQIAHQEFIWWKNVVQSTFIAANKISDFTDFAAFFKELYTYFATEQPWYIYPDVIPQLKKWRQQGIELGVISNFDTRLNQILQSLELEIFFDTITISSVAGFVKPHHNIFKIALKKHGCLPQQAWHIGDSFIEDYQGAKEAGIHAFWLNRSLTSGKTKNQLPNLSSLG